MMKDHWPDQEEGDTLRPLLPSEKKKRMSSKNKSGSSKKSSDAEDDDTYNDDAFVVRRKQSAPDGEEDSRSASRAISGGDDEGTSVGSSRRAGSSRRDEHSDYEQDDAASLAELSNYGSGVDLHPHHKRRSKHATDHSSRHRERRHSNGATSESDNDGRRRSSGHRNGGHRDSGNRGHESRRRKPRYEEEEFWSEDNKSHSSVQYNPRSRGRNSRGSRHSSRSPTAGGGLTSRLSNIPGVGTVVGFFDGVNIKTVLLCILGMTMVMKLNSNPPPPINSNHGMGSDVGNPLSKVVGMDGGPATVSSPGVRGAMLNDESGDDQLVEDEGEGEEEDEVLGENEEGGAFPSDAGGAAEGGALIPPPPPGQPQMQAVAQPGAVDGAVAQDAMAQQGYATQQAQADGSQQAVAQQAVAQQGYYVQQPQQPLQQQQVQQVGANYAVGQSSTYAQSPLAYQQQQMAGSVAAGVPVTQQGAIPGAVPQAQFGAAVDPSLMAPPGTVVQPQVQVDANGQPVPMVDANGQPLVAQPAVGAVDANGQPLAAQPAVDANGQPIAPVAADGTVATAETDAAAAVPLVPAPAPEGDAPAVEGSLLGLLDNFKDTWDEYDERATPMFWHIPKAGGSSIKDAMGGCHRFVQATEFGITDGHDADTEVAIVYPAVPGVADTDRSPFVNIDSTTVAGIARAKELGFADAQLAQVVVSPFVFETNDLFTQTAKGRLFSVFRHPIDRAVSMFYYIRVADWEPSYSPEMKDWTIEEYAASDRVENNWMTRQLSNQLGGELTDENLNKAMEVVRTKFLVGLMTKIEPSMTRFEKFFRWTYHVNPPNQDACRERLMGGGSNSNKANKKEAPKEGDQAWELLAQQNNFDLQLYAYIETLFEEQEQFVAGMPDDFRLVDGTCCKCDPPTYPPEGFTCPQAVKNEG